MTNETQTTQHDEQLIELQAILGPLTDDERDELLTHITVATEDAELPESTCMNACVQLAYLGLNRRDIQEVIHPVAEYTSRWMLAYDIKTVADYAGMLMSVFGFDHEELADALETTDEACVGRMVIPEQIMLAMEYCAPVAEHIGYPFEEIVSDISEKIEQGRHAAQVGRNLQKRYQTAGQVMATIERSNDE